MRRPLGACALILLAAGVAHATPLAPYLAPPSVGLVEWMSGLPVNKAVPVKDLSVEETRAHLKAQMEEELATLDIDGQAQALSRMGFVPVGIDFAQVYLDLLTQQIAAFYDLKTGRYYNVSRFGPMDLLGEPVTVSHELTHAAQDQTAALRGLFQHRGDDDDRVRAVQWVMEGQATLLGNRAGNMLGAPFPGPLGLVWGEVSTFLLWTPPFKALTQASMQNAMAAESERIPPYLVDSLLDAYLDGSRFVWTVERALGRDAHLWLLCHPPQSTEQIIHPQKYLRGLDPPRRVRIPELGGVAVRTDVTMGEWSLRWLLGGDAGAAAEWGGDRLALMKDGSVVWRIVMDTPAAAQRLEPALRKVIPDVVVARDGAEVHVFHGVAANDVPARSAALLKHTPDWYVADPAPAPGSACARITPQRVATHP